MTKLHPSVERAIDEAQAEMVKAQHWLEDLKALARRYRLLRYGQYLPNREDLKALRSPAVNALADRYKIEGNPGCTDTGPLFSGSLPVLVSAQFIVPYLVVSVNGREHEVLSMPTAFHSGVVDFMLSEPRRIHGPEAVVEEMRDAEINEALITRIMADPLLTAELEQG